MSETKSPPEAHSPVHAHEKTDADVRNLMFFGLAVAGLVIFGFIVAEVAFRAYVGKREVKQPTALFSKGQMPPAPLIQEHQGVELQRYLKQQNHVLDSYGWVDRKAGIVRIPIRQAMTLLLQQGLPVRSGPPILAPSSPWTLPRGDFGPPVKGVKGPQNQ